MWRSSLAVHVPGWWKLTLTLSWWCSPDLANRRTVAEGEKLSLSRQWFVDFPNYQFHFWWAGVNIYYYCGVNIITVLCPWKQLWTLFVQLTSVSILQTSTFCLSLTWHCMKTCWSASVSSANGICIVIRRWTKLFIWLTLSPLFEEFNCECFSHCMYHTFEWLYICKTCLKLTYTSKTSPRLMHSFHFYFHLFVFMSWPLPPITLLTNNVNIIM